VRRHRRTRPAVVATLAAGALATGTVAGHSLWPASAGSHPAASAPAGTPDATGTPDPAPGATDPATAAARIDGAVVDVYATYRYQQARGAGTGIVLTSTGEVLTNNHVIAGATSIQAVDVGSGRTYTARVIGYDKADDVAVLQLDSASGLQTAPIGDSGALRVGQAVVAVGNAGGVGGTPSAAAGSVTALDQAITASDELDGASETLSHLIETDADVRSGDSGGPLVDNTGKVVGMDTAAAQGFSLQSATSGASEGYAIPIARALAIAHQIETGVSSATVHVGPTAFLGVLVSSPADSPFGAARTPGAMVSSVVPGSAAASAGLAAGDVITGIDGRTVTGPATLTELLAGDQPGRSITIGWTDASGGSHTATTALQAGPPA